MDSVQHAGSLVLYLLHHVPDTVWAALIAAGVAFVTTTLSNRHSRKELRMQLDHNASERDRDRAMALRRDVYLPAIEAVTRTQAALGQVVDLNADVSALSKQMVADFSTIAKVHLIAGEATVRGLLAFQKALMPAYFELLTRRASLDLRRGAIATEQSLFDRALAEHQKLTQMMQQINLANSPDAPAAMERVKAQADIQMKEMKAHAGKEAALHAEQMADHLSVMQRLTELSSGVAELMPETLLSARAELDLPIDPDLYKRLFVEQQEAVQNTISEFVEGLRKAGPRTDRVN